MSEIAGRHILVTGGASGIGRRMATKLAVMGGRLSIWDINQTNLNTAVEELNATRRATARGFRCDVSQRAEVYRVAADTAAAGGPVDVLINNAGVVSGARLLDIPDEKIEATFAVNTLSLFWTAKAFLPQMLERNRGHIVTIASASGFIGVPKLADYSASKWAAIAFDESLRAELAQLGATIRTTVVCPFYVDTGMFNGVRTRFSWLLPILKEDDVATRVVDAIQQDKPRLLMPPVVYLVPAMRLFPIRIFDWLDVPRRERVDGSVQGTTKHPLKGERSGYGLNAAGTPSRVAPPHDSHREDPRCFVWTARMQWSPAPVPESAAPLPWHLHPREPGCLCWNAITAAATRRWPGFAPPGAPPAWSRATSPVQRRWRPRSRRLTVRSTASTFWSTTPASRTSARSRAPPKPISIASTR